MATQLSVFNTQLIRFFEELQETFPEEKEIRMAMEAISAAKKVNPRLILDMFFDHIYVDFHRAIADRQVERIVALGRQKIATQFNEVMPAITLFDKHWTTLGEPNKEAIWKYLHVLCILCERARGIPSDM
jgi:acyl carrier protein phosphodiesterase